MDNLQQENDRLKQRIEMLENQLSQLIINDWSGLILDLNRAGMSSLFATIVSVAHTAINPPDRILEAEALDLISNAKRHH